MARARPSPRLAPVTKIANLMVFQKLG